MSEETPLEIALVNSEWMESQYARFLSDPSSLSKEWVDYFDRLEEGASSVITEKVFAAFSGPASKEPCRIQVLIDHFRAYGHLAAETNPVASSPPSIPKELLLNASGFSEQDLADSFPTLGILQEANAPLLDIVNRLKALYCGKVGYEFKGIVSKDLELWLEEQIEKEGAVFSQDQKLHALKLLSKSELFESFLHMKFPGQKRFSLEGAETLIPIMAEILDECAQKGCEELIIGMAHRGRLNVLANIMNKSYEEIFSEFDEGYFPDSFEGTGDVKYHKGFLSEVQTLAGHEVKVTMVPNPSHLESVNAVVQGQTKGLQVKKGDLKQLKVVPLLVHGDAAIAGQGVVYETFQLAKLPGYSTGGTLHLVVNNQIGFTTSPEEGRSTRYCTDIAKTFGIPVFHLNAEDPESCIQAARLATEIRYRFHSDVILELNCYRKYGHNESDEPFFTQPLLYQKIRTKKSIRTLYNEQLISQGLVEKYMAEAMEEEFKNALSKAQASALSKPQKQGVKEKVKGVKEIPTAISQKDLRSITEHFCQIPEGFHPHPKLEQLFKHRLTMAIQDKASIDWGMAEFLALASLLVEGNPVRLAGQDVGRGTFSHRHALWVDQETGASYFPLSHLSSRQARADVINSPLSEYAALGFEYGYSVGYPETVVIWEAQFGDFVNGGQVVIDQYIAPAEQKWAQRSDLTLLLPHGYEGQGPEHSSARIERFLSLAGHQNLSICYPSTPAQFFHLLRRQGLSSVQKPLIVFTPKALLRLPECVNEIKDFTEGSFQPLLKDPRTDLARQILFCSGKIYYELLKLKEKEKLQEISLIRLEELYPFPELQIKELLQEASKATRFCWIQEEPANMGAFSYVRPRIESLLPKGALLEYIGREASAVTAVGSYVLHKKELSAILEAVKASPKKEPIEVQYFHRA